MPYVLEHCQGFNLANPWEDLFMNRCLRRVLSLGSHGFAACTSGLFMGFDRVLSNGKNQTANAEQLLEVRRSRDHQLAAE